VSRNVAAKDAAVVSVGAFLAGDAGNVIPQTAILRLSIRTSSPATRKLVLDKVRSITAAQAEAFGVTHEIREGAPGAVLVNDPAQTAECAELAGALLGEDQVVMPGPTFMGSEDFAYYAQHKPGTYCFIGNGDTPMVHHPMYDFDDRNLPIGAAYWVAVTEHYLK
ncbi:MAG: amidohydrolase, partial [Thauera phenolivorans]|nr:amidohydrolase [Thauera phenolivorans]